MTVCRLCGAAGLETVLVHDRAPANVSRLLRADELAGDRAVRVDVRRCPDCGFVQLDEPPGRPTTTTT
jgi:hypothetical protein